MLFYYEGGGRMESDNCDPDLCYMELINYINTISGDLLTFSWLTYPSI